jgi:hypothetical protein
LKKNSATAMPSHGKVSAFGDKGLAVFDLIRR